MSESLTTLQVRNIEASIDALQKELDILARYRAKGFISLEETIYWLSGQIASLEDELEEDKD